MDDLISRQAAIDAINNYFGFNIGEEYGSAVQEVINGLPPVQPERKNGKWIATQEWGGRNYSCSCCRFSFTVDTCMLEPMWNFCPNCGAEIEGRG